MFYNIFLKEKTIKVMVFIMTSHQIFKLEIFCVVYCSITEKYFSNFLSRNIRLFKVLLSEIIFILMALFLSENFRNVKIVKVNLFEYLVLVSGITIILFIKTIATKLFSHSF